MKRKNLFLEIDNRISQLKLSSLTSNDFFKLQQYIFKNINNIEKENDKEVLIKYINDIFYYIFKISLNNNLNSNSLNISEENNKKIFYKINNFFKTEENDKYIVRIRLILNSIIYYQDKHKRENKLKKYSIFKVLELKCMKKYFTNQIELMKKELKIEELKKIIKIFDKCIYQVNNEIVDYNKNIDKEKNILKNLKTIIISNLQIDEIIYIKELTKNIKNEEIKRKVLILFYEHNLKYYKRLQNKLLKLQENQFAKYGSLLNEYGILIKKHELKKIMYNEVKDVEEILEIISKYNLSSSDLVLILQNTNVKIVNQIKEFINKCFLDISFLKENIDIFYLDSPKLKQYIFNLNEVLKYELNPMLFKNNYNLLLSNNSLSKNLNILAQYNLIKGLKNLSNYSFLENNNLEEKIDLLIELNLFNILENNLDILNYDNLKRLELLKKMGYELNNIEEIRNYLEGRFFIQDNLIDTYLGNILEFIDEEELNILIDDLEIYKINDRTYEINGVLISVNKVKRKLEEGYSLYQAITFNKNLNLEDYNKLIDSLRSINSVKKISKKTL